MRFAKFGAVATALFVTLASSPANAQTSAPAAPPVRMRITSVGDTLLTFETSANQWVRMGQTGIAVDPRRGDELIARFRVVSVNAAVATAVITGQTTRVTALHEALLERPRERFYSRSGFWLGAGVGALVGVLVGSVF